MKEIYINAIADRLDVKPWQVENCERLFAEGSTIPFISRYRKERTGGLDDVAVAEIRHWVDVFNEMEKRKETVIGTIEQAGGLTEQLRSQIESSVDAREIEDLYLPFKPKRRTRATVAKEAGLDYKVGKFPFTASGKATASGERDGFVKLISDAASGKLLGAHLVGANVTEMISGIVLARRLGAGVKEIVKTIHPHPTMSEAIMGAAEVVCGECIHL